MKVKVILNPETGRGRGRKTLPRVREELRRRQVAFDLSITQGPGHAIQLAREAALAGGYDCVVAVGGDGTVNEVVNGLIAAAQDRGDWEHGEPAGVLGVIPIGSGNDFAFALGIRANDIPRACDRIVAGEKRLIDLLHVMDERPHGLFYCNNLGAGFDAAVNIEARKLKRLRGFLLYFIAVFRTLALEYHMPLTRITYEETELHLPITLASAANGPRTGGGFLMAPDAQIDDGLFDLCVAKKMSRLEILRILPSLMRGTHVDKPPVQMIRTAHVLIEAPDGLPVHVDGEVFHTGARRLEIRVWPRRLWVLT